MQIGLPFSATVPVASATTGEVRERKPWKRVRPTSVATYAELRDKGQLAHDRAMVLRCLAAFKNDKGIWPTADELQNDMAGKGEIPDDGNPNHVRPRLTELSCGWDVTREINGVRTKVHIHCDIVERGPKRPSRLKSVTRRVYTWQIKERQ
jgi:hypothetical protein